MNTGLAGILVPLATLLIGATSPPSTGPVYAMTCRGAITSVELVEHASYDATFHNASSVAADEIRVAIPYGRTKTAMFDLRATFPPNGDVAESLHKNLTGGLFAYASSDPSRCTVTYVHFVDGTSWGRR